MRVTLDILQHVYDKLTDIAQKSDRSVEDLLLEQAASLELEESVFYRHPEQDEMQKEVDHFNSNGDE